MPSTYYHVDSTGYLGHSEAVAQMAKTGPSLRSFPGTPLVMRALRQSLVFLIIVATVAGASSAAEPAGLHSVHGETTITIAFGKRPLVEYHYKDVPFKPYVAKLYSPEGVQILRDSPRDHKHHHGLMFALQVDGVDFWSERPGCGSQKSQSLDPLNGAPRNAQARAGFVEQLTWTEPRQGKAMLLERRAIEVLRRKQPRPVTLLSWRSRLAAPPGKDSVKLTGSHYFGLGMRFLASMDRDGRFFSSAQPPGKVVCGTERLVPAKWCAYPTKADGKPVTVAIFDHPKNPRHPSKMFTMTRPFAYLSATLNLWKQPLELKAAEPLALCYGVALWDGTVEPAEVEALYRRWAATNAHQPQPGVQP